MITTAQKVRDYFSPYGKKKIFYSDKRNTWLTVDKTFTAFDVLRHVKGLSTYGFFSTFQTDLVGIDIDEHGVFLDETLRGEKIKAKYFFLVEVIGSFPSLVFKTHSSGGLHCFYKFTEKQYYKILHQELARLLADQGATLKGFELRPTPGQGLRFPQNTRKGGTILDTETLAPLSVGGDIDLLYTMINQAPVYNVIQLLDFSFGSVLKPGTSTGQFTRYKQAQRFEAYAKRFEQPILAGHTNEALKKITYNGYLNGIPSEETAEYFFKRLLENRIEIKKDTTEKSILRRVNSFYKFYGKVSILETDFQKTTWGTENIFFRDRARLGLEKVREVFGKLHGHKEKSIENFLYRLYEWTAYIDGLTIEKRLQLNTLYKYFYHYTLRKNLIPLPTRLLKKWNQRYFNFFSMLCRAGLLAQGRKGFNPYLEKEYNPGVQGICAYYKINAPGA